MLNHVSIGVRDIASTKRFYDAALKPLGYTCLSEGDDLARLRQGRGRAVDLGERQAGPGRRPNPACTSASMRRRRKSVAAFHAGALGAGGQDNGKPGLRAD